MTTLVAQEAGKGGTLLSSSRFSMTLLSSSPRFSSLGISTKLVLSVLKLRPRCPGLGSWAAYSVFTMPPTRDAPDS